MPKNKFTLWEKDGKIMLDQSGTPYGYIPTWWRVTWDFDSGTIDGSPENSSSASIRISFYYFYGFFSGRIFAKTISQNSQNTNCEVTIEDIELQTMRIRIAKPENASSFASKGEITFCVDAYNFASSSIEQDLEQHPEYFEPGIRTSIPSNLFPDAKITASYQLL